VSGRPVTTSQVQRVVELVKAGRRDTHIARDVGVARVTVQRIREDHQLPANYGPGRPPREESTR
jgi:hypothetical protein